MIPSALAAVAALGSGCSPNPSTKLIEVRPVDRDVIMVFFKDGEVRYRDDGTGPSAFQGHAFADGDDELVSYGDGLRVEVVSESTSWMLRSQDDDNYGLEGMHPTKVHRRAKADNVDHAFNYKLDHTVYLVWPHALQEGKRYSLSIAKETGSDVLEAEFIRDTFTNVSEAVHVNIIGYLPDAPIKSADLYHWLGDGGPRDYGSFEGNPVHIVDVESGASEIVGEVRFWMKGERELNIGNLTGSDVWNVDFSEFSKPGRYRLAVEGVGCSPEFEIADSVYREPLKTSTRGFFYMRVGEDGKGVSPIPRRPLFIPGEDPEGFVIYLTDFHPYHEVWSTLRGDVWDEPHFKPAEESIFWRHRLPGNPTNPNAVGGHADALDWDRHLGHVSMIYDLLLPYYLSEGALGDDDFEIAESGNGVPDLIDEARNEVDLWLSLRDGDAYAHGLTNPSKEKTVMFQAGATTMAAWANALNCAMLADCFRLSGHEELMTAYTAEAETAYVFAQSQGDQLDDSQEVGGTRIRGRDFKMMAAAFLYNLTGDEAYEGVVARESVVTGSKAEIENRGTWNQIWGTAAYLLTPRECHYPDLKARMNATIRNEALRKCVAQTGTRPSRRSSVEDYWQTPSEVQLMLLAHVVSDDESEREALLRAMILEADWTLGRNPMNMVHMTGLGSRHVEGCYTTGGNDGTPGLHPGHTPYMNINNWGGQWEGSHPEWFAERGYPDWEEGSWPFQEAYWNCRYSWANSEFTPQQTMRGKHALYGYLYALGK